MSEVNALFLVLAPNIGFGLPSAAVSHRHIRFGKHSELFHISSFVYGPDGLRGNGYGYASIPEMVGYFVSVGIAVPCAVATQGHQPLPLHIGMCCISPGNENKWNIYNDYRKYFRIIVKILFMLSYASRGMQAHTYTHDTHTSKGTREVGKSKGPQEEDELHTIYCWSTNGIRFKFRE